MKVINNGSLVLRIDAPEWFAMPAFMAALDRGTSPDSRARIATYHLHGTAPSEYSDIFIPFEAQMPISGGGTARWTIAESDLLYQPGLESVRESVAAIVQEHRIHQGVLWITNVGLLRKEASDCQPGTSDRL